MEQMPPKIYTLNIQPIEPEGEKTWAKNVGGYFKKRTQKK